MVKNLRTKTRAQSNANPTSGGGVQGPRSHRQVGRVGAGSRDHQRRVVRLRRLSVAVIPLLAASCSALQRVSGPTQWGYMNSSGETILEPTWAGAGHFEEGLAFVTDMRTSAFWQRPFLQYGYVNFDGKVVVRPRYDDAWSFSEGLAVVQQERRYWFIDRSGRKRIGPFAAATSFAEGMAPVRVSDDGKWGYINRQGKFVIEPRFDRAGSFSEGLAFVFMDEKLGFIGKDGAFVIPPKFETAWDFHEGLAPVRIGEKWGFVDRAGEFSIPPQFEWARPFSEGLAHVAMGKQREGYIDKSGRLAVPAVFAVAGDFSEGVAFASPDGRKYGFIDHSGKYVIEPRFWSVGTFSQGLAPYRAEGP